MQLIYSNTETLISLDTALNTCEPIVLYLEPFVDVGHIHLEIRQGLSFQAFCSCLHEGLEAFTIPRYSTHLADIPSQSFFVLTRDEWGYTAFFCLSHQDVIASLGGASEGLVLHLTSGRSQEANKRRSVLFCLRGSKLNDIMNVTMKMALELTGGMGKLVEDKLSPPAWLDYLGWESGIALGPQVSHDKILEAVKSLCQIGYPPGYVLIDEGWQHLAPLTKDKSSRLAMLSFEADPVRFPRGIKGIIEDLRQLGIKYVGIWHGMMGYRGGIHPQLAQIYNLHLGPDGRYFLGQDLGRTFQFFDDYYGYLREQGVAFIKVGDQSAIHAYCPPGSDVTLLYKNLQSAMQAAASIQFNSAHFNTECLRNENLFYWGNSRIARAADDIDISNPVGMMRAIRNNLTNSLWLQHLMQPDFDTWVTNTVQSETLAIFHALSGTINVVGDPPNQHDKNLIRKIVLPGDRILKADRPLNLCEDSIFFNPLEEKKVYKAFTFKRNNGIIGAFNLTSGKRTLHGTVSSKDIGGLTGDLFAVLSYRNGFLGIVQAEETLAITLKPNQSDVFTFAPVKNGIAVIGCYSFFLSPGPITEIHIDEDMMHISTLVTAPIIIYCERQILEIRRNGTTIPWEYDNNRKTLSIDSRTQILNVHSIYNILFSS
jgi:Raffinose synthase or seed imbibition protein Sip1